ncbi:hypothetical protein Slin15195_G048520 [Septoria linicola]|uniref:NTF2-like domain-containing protein n=1 Tax=Septoria linicola TaxID=215465 RepID=A0A9Q9AQZ8_9PEZI|nr:hypothetical protein Slin14017_G052080 [Septoria linicola]USW51533.1 hypothetical protein Slin15195_G048520 [Septoria linicola]
MLRATLLAVAGLLSLAVAAPPGPGAANIAGRQQPCLDDGSAQRIAENFRTLITNYSNQSAAAFLTVDFLDYSDGVNILINKGCPNGPQALGSPTFSSLEEFQAGQGSQVNIPFEILNVWHGCDFVTMRWRSSAPEANDIQPQQPVTGIVVLEVCQGGSPEPWVIDTVYSEFNSGAWLYDKGFFKPEGCDATQAKLRRSLGLLIDGAVRML